MNETSSKRKLVAVTHNYIGKNLRQSLPNKTIELDDRVIVPISAEHLLKSEPLLPGNFQNHQLQINRVRDKKIADQQPDVLMLYIGSSSPGQALDFATLFTGAEIHLVLTETKGAKANFLQAVNGRELSFWPVLHFAETTGNLTMERLIQEFYNTGKILPELVWW